MQSHRFIHLRTHSEHSLLQGAVPVKKDCAAKTTTAEPFRKTDNKISLDFVQTLWRTHILNVFRSDVAVKMPTQLEHSRKHVFRYIGFPLNGGDVFQTKTLKHI